VFMPKTGLYIAAIFTACSASPQDHNTGLVSGTVVAVDSNGDRSAVPRANVHLLSATFSRQTVADDEGRYRFSDVPAGEYRLEATASGLNGSNHVNVIAGAPADISIELQLNIFRESAEVASGSEPPLSTEPSTSATIERSNIVNAPNKYDRVDAFLPLVPGVVRGPDGLINRKGARASQTGSLVTNANVTDPATARTVRPTPHDRLGLRFGRGGNIRRRCRRQCHRLGSLPDIVYASF
jgi:hypothetical protein